MSSFYYQLRDAKSIRDELEDQLTDELYEVKQRIHLKMLENDKDYTDLSRQLFIQALEAGAVQDIELMLEKIEDEVLFHEHEWKFGEGLDSYAHLLIPAILTSYTSETSKQELVSTVVARRRFFGENEWLQLFLKHASLNRHVEHQSFLDCIGPEMRKAIRTCEVLLVIVSPHFISRMVGSPTIPLDVIRMFKLFFPHL